MPQVYVAGPYSSPSAITREQRFMMLTEVAAYLWENRITNYSPITEGHAIVTFGGRNVPGDWEFWKEHDREMIGHCRIFLRVLITGHEQSVGLAAEAEIARTMGKPIIDYRYGHIEAPLFALAKEIRAALAS